MTINERLEDARDNLRAADRFRRAAETLLDERMQNAAQRNAFLTPEEKNEALHNLQCYGAHFGAAVEILAPELAQEAEVTRRPPPQQPPQGQPMFG